jgi:hypothetical protein
MQGVQRRHRRPGFSVLVLPYQIVNIELENRWRRGECPFDGPVLIASDWLSENALLMTVRNALALLRKAHGTRGLYANQDWHDHDGFVTSDRAVTWTEAQSWTRDVEQLRRSCSDDWRVHTLLYPDNFAFCLRYWLDDEGEGLFDLCGARGMFEKLVSSMQADGAALRIELSAKDCFDRSWGG